MKKVWLIVTLWLFLGQVWSQEFNCRVQINAQQLTGTDKSVVENFRSSVEEFMNTQAWTNLQLTRQERLDCSMMFLFKKQEGDTYFCDFQLQLQRPIFGSTLTTSLLSLREELSFDYQQNQVLQFNETNIDGNLMATLAFWSYVMLGLDFDSFSRQGGTPFFQKAQDIASQAQGAFGELWKAQEDKNHWGWINALTTETQQQMRQLSYEYHRLGLDVMHQDVEKGKSAITQALTYLKPVKQTRPGSPLLPNFLDTKADELVNVYSKATAVEKQRIYDLLNEIYPAASNRLQGIKTLR
ncbi:MAG TPA: DUF4835 domain-containing protein [Bacteroidales bacterium]|nr:DUF4835 domain-containing protein [Bacteroidales bacterium]